MNRLLSLVAVLLLMPSLLWAEAVLGPAANPFVSSLYDYRSTIELQDDFWGGTATSGSIGVMGWSSGGTITSDTSSGSNIGLMKLDTSAVSGTTTRLNLNGNDAAPSTAWWEATWIIKLNNNDANTTVTAGMSSIWTTVNHLIGLQKLDADTNWFCVTNNNTTPIRVDSGVAVSTSFVRLTAGRNPAGAYFRINGVPVCGIMSTSLTTAQMGPGIHIINSAASSKTLHTDYFQLRVTNISR